MAGLDAAGVDILFVWKQINEFRGCPAMTVDFSRDEGLEIVTNTVGTFAREKLRPKIRSFETAKQVTEEIASEFDALGLPLLQLPETLGGASLGMLARVLVNRELAKADAGAAIALDRIGPAFHVLQSFGGQDALQRFVLPIVQSKDQRAVLVLEEECPLVIGDARVAGTVAWAPTGRADLVVGLGHDRAWVATKGIEMRALRGAGLRAAGAAELHLDSPIEAEWSGRDAANDALAKIRLHVASLLVGVLFDATEFSRSYGMERVAFGRPVAHHQAMAFLMVDMQTAVERAWLLIEDAASQMDAGASANDLAAAAFVEAVEASRLIGPNGVQILGGHGFMADFPMEKAMRESRTLGLLAGGIDRAREDAATRLVQQRVETDA